MVAIIVTILLSYYLVLLLSTHFIILFILICATFMISYLLLLYQEYISSSVICITMWLVVCLQIHFLIFSPRAVVCFFSMLASWYILLTCHIFFVLAYSSFIRLLAITFCTIEKLLIKLLIEDVDVILLL